MINFFFRILIILALVPAVSCFSQDDKDRYWPRMIMGGEYWWMAPDAEYLDYLKAVRPDLIHGGVVGPELASGVHGRGSLKAITPLHPADVGTMEAYLAWWREYLKEVHALGVKVQATFSLVNAWGDHETQSGWFRYFNELWETGLLGERPAEKAESLMEMDLEGQLLRGEGKPGWYRYRGCVNNPSWREVLKRFSRTAIDAGFDGMMIQYSHARGNCLCGHCQNAFRAFLGNRHSDDVLAGNYGITNLATHVFGFTVPGNEGTDPFDLEARAFSDASVRGCFDEVFLQDGRSLKADLILSNWFHFRRFLAQDSSNTDFRMIIDERMMRDVKSWCEGEDYVWNSSPIYNSNLADGITGDSALDGRYLRAMSGGTPFLVLKYDYFRWRVSAAEALAQGGIVFGCWKGGWSGGTDRDDPHFNRYFQFIRANDHFWHQRTRYAEVGLLFPRSALQQGDAGFLERFRQVGRELVRRRILFDIVIDQSMTEDLLLSRQWLLIPAPGHVSQKQQSFINAYIARGGKVMAWGDPGEFAVQDGVSYAGDDPEALVGMAAEQAGGFSTFEAPWTVQVYADRQAAVNRCLIHLVNFDRDESQQGRELPRMASAVPVSFRLPPGCQVKAVTFYTPEKESAESLSFQQVDGRLEFTTPSWLVYGLCVIDGHPADGASIP